MADYLQARKKVLLIGLGVMLVTCLPYIIGYSSQGEAWIFSGFVLGVEDGNSYIAKMLAGAWGDWLFRSPYSGEAQAGALAFLPYLILGKLTAGAAQHEQLVALFHGYRFLAGILASLAAYDFISLFMEDETRRLWALAAILVGGGTGWILAVAGMKDFLGSLPLDFISPESFGFLALFGLPHLALARALLFWGIVHYLKKDTGYLAGLLWLAMGLFQPMFIVIVWAVAGFHAVVEVILEWLGHRQGKEPYNFRSSYLRKILEAAAVSCPLVIYTAGAFYLDPYLSAWTDQNYLPSPHWIHYLIAYGLVLPFTVWGIVKIYRKDRSQGLFLSCWIVILPFLVYAPVSTQRRLSEGIWLVLVTGFFSAFKEREPIPSYGKIVIGMMLPTSIFLMWGAAARSALVAEPVFVPRTQVNAYLYLKEIAPKEAVVLSSFEVGNSLPAWAPVRVVQGHGPETVHLESWENKIEDYFQENAEVTSCGDFFAEAGINYLFWGPQEMKLWEWDPEIKTCLKQVYNESGYSIYQVAE